MNRTQKGIAVAAVFLVLAALGLLKFNERATEKRQAEKLRQAVCLGFEGAAAKNEQALRLCEAELNTILAQEFPELGRQGQAAAEDIASYSSCCKIIVCLARDKLKGANSTGEYVDSRMQAHMQATLRKLSADLQSALDRFELSLNENTVCFARELAQINPRREGPSTLASADLKSTGDTERALRDLGISGIAIGVCVPLDVWAVASSKVVKSLINKSAVAAARLFARPAASVAAEITIASADGPLPIGDAIALVGGLWTAYDVYSSQKQFEREMKAAIEKTLPDIRGDLQKQVLEHARTILNQQQQLQDEIRQKAVKEFFS